MSGIFKESTISKLKNIRKGFLWSAVCILIVEVIVGAVLILTQSFNLTIGKLMGTFALCAVVLFLGVSNFAEMEKGKRITQWFALVSLIMNMTWLILAILLIWEIVPSLEYTNSLHGFYSSARPSIAMKLMTVALDAGVGCFLVSIVLSIEETVKPVRPLKITALVCELYCCVYAIIISLGDVTYITDFRWGALAGLAGFAFIVMSVAAAIVSRSGAKKNGNTIQAVDKGTMEATIQEMVEKEVQERMRKEREKMERDAMPPLQTEAEATMPLQAKTGETTNENEIPPEVGIETTHGPLATSGGGETPDRSYPSNEMPNSDEKQNDGRVFP